MKMKVDKYFTGRPRGEYITRLNKAYFIILIERPKQKPFFAPKKILNIMYHLSLLLCPFYFLSSSNVSI